MSNHDHLDLNDDDVLLSLLGETLDEAEPLSEELAATVSDAAFELRSLDAVLADMVYDSAVSAGGTRSDDSSRNLVFSKDGVEVDIELAADGVTIHGLVQPADATCELETPAGVQPIDVDGSGRFDLSIDARRLRLILNPSAGARIATPWIFR